MTKKLSPCRRWWWSASVVEQHLGQGRPARATAVSGAAKRQRQLEQLHGRRRCSTGGRRSGGRTARLHGTAAQGGSTYGRRRGSTADGGRRGAAPRRVGTARRRATAAARGSRRGENWGTLVKILQRSHHILRLKDLWSRFQPRTGTKDPLVAVGNTNRDQRSPWAAKICARSPLLPTATKGLFFLFLFSSFFFCFLFCFFFCFLL